MNVRELAWHDLVTLYKYRGEILALDKTQLLTRGSPIGFAASLTTLHPAYSTYSSIVRGDKSIQPLMGSMQYRMGNRSARLSYLAPERAIATPALNLLLEDMAAHAGDWGALTLLAELEETSPAFEAVRKAGFNVYAWQRIWRFTGSGSNGNGSGDAPTRTVWKPAVSLDEIPVRNLYQCLVPPLVQGAEAFPNERLQPRITYQGLVYRQDDEVLGFVETTHGPQGIFLNPIIHPSVSNAGGLLSALCEQLSPLLGRPIYLAVRSYQAWLEPLLNNLAAEPGMRTALLVKHLARLQRSTVTSPRLGVIDKVKTEPGASITRQSSRSNATTAHD